MAVRDGDPALLHRAQRLVSREEGRPRGASDAAASQRPGGQQLIGVASLRATSPGIDGRGLGWRVLFSKLREVPSRLVPSHDHQDVGCPRNLKKTRSVHVDCARGHCHFNQHSRVPQFSAMHLGNDYRASRSRRGARSCASRWMYCSAGVHAGHRAAACMARQPLRTL